MSVISIEDLREKITTMHEEHYSIRNLIAYELTDFPEDILIDLGNVENREVKNYYLNWLIYNKQVVVVETKASLLFKI